MSTDAEQNPGQNVTSYTTCVGLDCEAGYNTKTLGNVFVTVGGEGSREMLEDIPM